MPVRQAPLILALCALSALSGCNSGGQDAPPPPSAAAQAAIEDEGGAPRVPLGHAIDALFDEEAVGRTHALVVAKRGSVIVERYGDGISAKTALPGWSAGQCVTALMIGQLVSDGRLRMDQTAPVPAWQRAGDPRGEITLKQLLQMRSGLRHVEYPAGGDDSGPAQTDRMRMLFLDGRDDMATYAEDQPLEAPAGRVFKDSSATSVILADLAARVLAPSGSPKVRREAVGAFLSSRVLDPIGLASMQTGYDRAGTLVGADMFHANARDWVKLGDFLRRNGSVKGAQILPRRWVQFMRRPSPRNPGYGAGVWLNGAPAGDDARLYPGTAPENLFACLGEQGQYVIGSPDQLLTVVRLGSSDARQQRVLHQRLGALLALFPGGEH